MLPRKIPARVPDGLRFGLALGRTTATRAGEIPPATAGWADVAIILPLGIGLGRRK